MKGKILTYTVSLAMAIAVAFGTGYNSTIDALLLTIVWLLIVFGGVIVIAASIGVVMCQYLKDEYIPINIIENWKVLESPNWWISLPLSAIWLSALIYVEWTVTAVAYFIETMLLCLVSTAMFKSIREIVVEKLGEDDPINSIKNLEVKQAVLDSRKDKYD